MSLRALRLYVRALHRSLRTLHLHLRSLELWRRHRHLWHRNPAASASRRWRPCRPAGPGSYRRPHHARVLAFPSRFYRSGRR